MTARRGARDVALATAWLIGGLLAFVASPPPARADEPADPGTTLHLTYGSGEAAHPYIVYVPKSLAPERPAPLLVLAHGCQTTAEQQMRASLYNGVAEREGFVILYPDVNAAEVAQPGPLTRCWQFFNPASWHRDAGDPAAIAGMTREVMARWRIDPDRVYMMGMSAGAFMTSVMAAAYPDLFAAVGIMAGGAYADGACVLGSRGTTVDASAQAAYSEMGALARVVPRLVMGGDEDAGIIPPCADKALEQGLRTDNLVISGSQEAPIPLTPASVREEPNPGGYSSTVSTYRDHDGCVVGERWLIHGMNHFWSGGSSDPQWANWTDPKGPSGAEASWRFFSRYTKRSTAMPCAETGRGPARRDCPARWLKVSVPADAHGVRATVNGRRATVRVGHTGVRVRLAASRRARTVLVVRGRTGENADLRVRHAYRGCGPGRSEVAVIATPIR